MTDSSNVTPATPSQENPKEAPAEGGAPHEDRPDQERTDGSPATGEQDPMTEEDTASGGPADS